MIIAIDGPAGSGKSTISRLIAQKLGFIYIDTGAMYRALTLKALRKRTDFSRESDLVKIARESSIRLSNNPDGSLKIVLDAEDVSVEVRKPMVTRFVSDLAKVRGVREVMLGLQRSLGLSNNSVLDGRDIGTVVFPDADKKFYLDADFNVRVGRRFKEMQDAGQKVSLADVEADLRNRDRIDSTRKVAPLKRADDAIYLDTTKLNIQQVVDKVFEFIKNG